MSQQPGEVPSLGFGLESIPQTLEFPESGPTLPPFEGLTPDEQWRELALFLQHDELVAHHLEDIAGFAELNIMFDTRTIPEQHPECQSLTAEAWRRCVDPEQPTLGLRGAQFPFAIQLALGAQQLRAAGETICNVVLLPEPAFAAESSNGSDYFAERGVIMDADGTVYTGDFPEALRIDAIPSSDHASTDSGNKGELAAHINDPGIETLFLDKSQVQERLRDTEIPHVTALVANVPLNDPELQILFLTAMKRGKPMVLKPTDSSLGKGVIMVDPARMSPYEVLSLLRARQEANPNGRYMLEPWIRSYPMTHPETGEPLDWNLRSYLVDGQSVGEFARVGSMGTAINTSRGANLKTLAEALEICGLSQEELALVKTRLSRLYTQIGEAFPEAGIIGPDIIVNKQLEPILLELNGERCGGLSSLLQTDPHAGFAPVRKTIRRLHRRLFPQQLPPAHPRNAARLEPGPRDILAAFGWVDMSRDSWYASQLINAVSVMRENQTVTPEGALPDFQKLFTFLTETGRPDLADIQQNLQIAAIEIVRRITQGEMDNAYEPLTLWLNTDPTDLRRLRVSSTTLLQLLRIKTPAAFMEQTLMLPALSPANAETFGRSLFLTLLDRADIDLEALSHRTIAQFLQVCTTFYLQDPHARRLPGEETLAANPQELGYLRPVLHALTCFAAIGRGDYAVPNAILNDCIHRRGEAAYPLGSILEAYFSNRESASDAEKHTYFLVTVAVGNLTGAYELHRQFSPGDRQQALEAIASKCEAEIAADITGAGGPSDAAHRQALLDAFLHGLEVVTAEAMDEQAVFGALGTIDALLGPLIGQGTQYGRLGGLREMLLGHIESRRNPEFRAY